MKKRKLSELGLGVVSIWLWCGCGTPSLPPVSKSSPAPRATATRSELCSEMRLSARGPVCMRKLSAEEQRHRELSHRLEFQNDEVVRRTRLNGRGFTVPDDAGCVEYRYRYQNGYVAESTGYADDGSVCDRNAISEQATRMAFQDAWGRVEHANDHVHTGLIQGYDSGGMVVRQRGFAADGSTVSMPSLASDLRFDRDERRFEKRLCYFDEKGLPMRSSAGIHCFTYRRDDFGNEVARQAWDEQGKPMVEVNGAHSLLRDTDRYGNLIRQRFLDLHGKPIASEQARCPTLVYQYDDHGFRTGADCLDGDGKPARFIEGNASWRSTPDGYGRTRELRYFDTHGAPYEPEYGYARVELSRDKFGRVTARQFFFADGSPGQQKGAPVVRYEWSVRHLEVKRSNFDLQGKPVRYKGCASTETEHDEFRQPVRQTCRGISNEIVLSSDNVGITERRYDARGLLVEVRYLDQHAKLVDHSSGFARISHSFDARGVETKSRRFKADGSELPLRRFNALWVRPARADRHFPGQPRDRALSQIEKARSELLAGLPLAVALHRYGNDRVKAVRPGDIGYLSFDQIFPAVRLAIESLSVGEYSRIVEVPHGFALYQRSE